MRNNFPRSGIQHETFSPVIGYNSGELSRSGIQRGIIVHIVGYNAEYYMAFYQQNNKTFATIWRSSYIRKFGHTIEPI